VRQELDPANEDVVAQTYVRSHSGGEYVVSTTSLRMGAMADEVAVVLGRYETMVFT
jgi:hypothetical protein